MLCGRRKPYWWSVGLKRAWEEKTVLTLHYGMTTASTINPPAEHPWMNSERCCIPFSRSFYLLFSFLHLYTNITINQTCSWHRNQFYTLVLERLSLKVRYVLWSAPTRVCDPLRAIVSLDRSRVCVRCGDFCFSQWKAYLHCLNHSLSPI